MISKVYRLFCLILSCALLLSAFPLFAAAEQRTGCFPAGYAVSKDQFNRVFFENIDDLKQLCAESYSDWTYVHYNGTGNLVINEDVVLPEFMSLQVYPAAIVIQKGCTLTAAPGSFIQCRSMRVQGTLHLKSDMHFDDSLTVYGKILAEGNIRYYDGATVQGADNIDFAQGNTFHISQEVYTVAELKALLENAEENSANYYHITPIFTDDTTIDRTLVFPENVTAYISTSYTDSVTVASGVTMTIYGQCNFETSLVINGLLVNHGQMDYIGSKLALASSDSYSGSGLLKVYQRNYAASYSDVLSGLDVSRFAVKTTGTDEYGFYWLLQDQRPAKPSIRSSMDAESGKPVLSWEAVSGGEKYRIYRATSKSGSYDYINTSTKESFVDTTAEPGIKYYYKVRAYNTIGGYSPWSNIVTRMCDLAQPSVTIAGDASSGKPVVKWETVSGAKKYFVYRATSKNGSYSRVYTAVSARSYTDSDTTPGETYYYKVKAIHENADANSAYSAVVKRMCDLKRPVVTISLTSGGNPYLKWSEISGAQKYYVYRAKSKTGSYTYLGASKSGKYVDKDVDAGKTYYYKVKAIHSNTSANSAYSAIDSIKAK